MATLYDTGVGAENADQQPETIRAAIETFLGQCRRPAILEAGETVIPLLPGEYALEIRSGRLSIEIWSPNRSISRRIVEISGKSTGILDCAIQKFGSRNGQMAFLDLERPQTAHRQTTGVRQNFGEQFRRMLTRQFPGWEIRTLSSAPDLRRSFSGLYARAHLSKGRQHIAAMGCAEAELEGGLMAFALIWHQHVRMAKNAEYTTRLALFLPQGTGNQTAHRLRWMNRDRLPASIYLFNEHGSAGEVERSDLGNLRTGLASQPWHEALKPEDVAAGGAERWLEQVVRARLPAIDAQLMPQPVYNQVLTFAGTDRDLIDLLAVGTDGRLTILELKVDEDLQLPIQALDYWMRIFWHAQRGELKHLFPRIGLQSAPPKLILLAPATAFHSTNATILRYFSSLIPVERVGVNMEWREELRVVLRLEGASVPASHEI